MPFHGVQAFLHTEEQAHLVDTHSLAAGPKEDEAICCKNEPLPLGLLVLNNNHVLCWLEGPGPNLQGEKSVRLYPSDGMFPGASS